MKTYANVSEFNNVVVNAKSNVKIASTNFFRIINGLNKLYSKNEYCDNTDIAKVGKVCKTLHNGKKPFDVALFVKDSNGRFCTVATSKTCPVYGFDLIKVEPKKWSYLKPIAANEISVFNAFCKVAKVDVKEQIKAEKATEQAKKHAAKERKTFNAKRETCIAIMSEKVVAKMTKEQIIAKYDLIRKAH